MADGPGPPGVRGAPESGAERRVLLAVILGASLAPLNSTMLLVALPDILDAFSAEVSTGSWLIISYLIAVAALQTPAGKLGDRLGHRRVFLGALVTFLVATAGAAAAPGLVALIGFRMAQGVAVAGVFPNGWAMLRVSAPPGRVASRFALVGSALSISVAVGPPLAGVLVDAAGWRSVFGANIALAGSALLLARRVAPAPTPAPVAPFDLVGALGWGALLTATSGLLSLSTGTGAGLVIIAGGLAAVGGAGVLLVRRALAHPDPVIQPRFFTRPAFAAANAGVGFGNLAFYVTLIVVPLVLDARPGATGLSTGLILSTTAVSLAVLAPVGGRLADRRGRRRPALLGMTIFVAGLSPLAVVGAGVDVPLLIACLVSAGAGLALATPAMQAAALDAVRPEESGAASGVYATSRYLGSILGSSFLAAVSDPTGRATFVLILAGAVAAAVSVSRLPTGRGQVPVTGVAPAAT